VNGRGRLDASNPSMHRPYPLSPPSKIYTFLTRNVQKNAFFPSPHICITVSSLTFCIKKPLPTSIVAARCDIIQVISLHVSV